MIERGEGRIINISSVLGRFGTPFNGAYVASKFALEGISESLRTELAPLGVRVSVVEPGLFETDFQKNELRATRADDPGYAIRPVRQPVQPAPRPVPVHGRRPHKGCACD